MIQTPSAKRERERVAVLVVVCASVLVVFFFTFGSYGLVFVTSFCCFFPHMRPKNRYVQLVFAYVMDNPDVNGCSKSGEHLYTRGETLLTFCNEREKKKRNDAHKQRMAWHGITIVLVYRYLMIDTLSRREEEEEKNEKFQ